MNNANSPDELQLGASPLRLITTTLQLLLIVIMVAFSARFLLAFAVDFYSWANRFINRLFMSTDQTRESDGICETIADECVELPELIALGSIAIITSSVAAWCMGSRALFGVSVTTQSGFETSFTSLAIALMFHQLARLERGSPHCSSAL